MVAVDDATPTLGAASACRVLGLPRASLYRGRRPVAVARPRPAPSRALDPIERQGILDLLHTRFIDQAPAQIHATLLDEGTYLCSPRTMYRVFDAAHEVKERRDQVRRPPYPGFPIWLWYFCPFDQSSSLDFRGFLERNQATEGDTQWVNYKRSPFSSRSTDF